MNQVLLRGKASGNPSFSHDAHGKSYYCVNIRIRRLSGSLDALNVLVGQALLSACEIRKGDPLEIEGQIRSFNNRGDQGSRLVLSVLAQSIRPSDAEDCNTVILKGNLCKTPEYRKTPLGREICDLLLAVPRIYGRADFIPVICWGQNARACAFHPAGQTLCVEGRFQSRPYTKLPRQGLK